VPACCVRTLRSCGIYTLNGAAGRRHSDSDAVLGHRGGPHDADTLTVDGTVYRLDGIDAPEKDQSCIGPNGVYPCGQYAIEALEELIGDRRVVCHDLGPDPKYPRRRIGHCVVEDIDLHRWLVRNGWAINFEPYARGRYEDDRRYARNNDLGMWKGCFVAPRDFRRWNKHTAPSLALNAPETPAACSFRPMH
jgi:endonuclease YncB( thermonuclease family)